MNHQDTTPLGRRSRRTVGVALAALVMLTLPATALAQGSSPEASSPASPAATDVAFPTTLAGQPVTPETFTGPEWLAANGDDATYNEGTEALLAGLGKTLDDLTVTSAMVEASPGNPAIVLAFQVDGTDPRQYVTEAADLLLGDIATPELLVRLVAGKWALRVVDAEQPGVYPRTLYLDDETLWVFQGDETYVWEALDQLPSPAAAAVDTVPLVTTIPLELGGYRRSLLYEVTEPLFLPALSERVGPALDDWLRDAYLEAGITPAEMIGIIALWGSAETPDGVQVEGYQLPGAPPELIERLRSEVLLASGDELPEGVGRSDGQIAGRDVVTLDTGSSLQHIFSSGDTVWIITDVAGQEAQVEEAISALP